MKKLIILIFIISTLVANAQFYTDFNIGYNKSILSEIRSSDITQYKYNDTNKIEYINDNKQQEIDNIFYFKQFGYLNINLSLGIRYTFGKANNSETVE